MSVLLDEDGDMVVHANKRAPFEPRTLALWVQWCIGSKIVVDVGAYTGVYSIAAAKAGASVLALEPHRKNAARLLRNVKHNEVEGITLLPRAATDKVARVPLYVNARVPLTSGGSLIERSGYDVMHVQSTTLDAEIGMRPVSAIKIDVEGHEFEVLKGADRTLRHQRPSLIVEVLSARRMNDVELMLVGTYGYRRIDVLDRVNYVYAPG